MYDFITFIYPEPLLLAVAFTQETLWFPVMDIDKITTKDCQLLFPWFWTDPQMAKKIEIYTLTQTQFQHNSLIID